MSSVNDATPVDTSMTFPNPVVVEQVEPDASLGDLKRFPPEVRQNIYKFIFLGNEIYLDHDYNEGGEFADIDDEMKPIDTSILYVNRVVSDEAAYVMYRDVKVVLRAADVMGLRPDYHDLLIATPDIWRFNPTRGIGLGQRGGDWRYLSRRKLNGEMYPHIFAKFQNVCLDLRMDLAFHACVGKYGHVYHCPKLWIDFENIADEDTNTTIRKEEQVEYVKHMKRTKLFHDLARILENSERITNLEIQLAIYTEPNCAYMGPDRPSPFPFAEYRFIYETYAANNLLAFLESGVCEPLSALTKVKSATVDFYEGYMSDEEVVEWYWPMTHGDKLLKPGRELEEMIVKNFRQEESELDDDSADESGVPV